GAFGGLVALGGGRGGGRPRLDQLVDVAGEQQVALGAAQWIGDQVAGHGRGRGDGIGRIGGQAGTGEGGDGKQGREGAQEGESQAGPGPFGVEAGLGGRKGCGRHAVFTGCGSAAQCAGVKTA